MIINFCILYICILSVIADSLERKIENIFSYSSNHYEELARVLVYILEKCVNEKSGQNVMIGSWTEDELYLLNKISSAIPVHLMKSKDNVIEDKYINFNVLSTTVRALEIPANNLVVISSSKAELLTSLRTLKTSYWWNHSGFFLVANKNVNNGCEGAGLLLQELWAFNVLAAVLLCYNSNHAVELYTFNPYNEFAPKLWNAVDGSRRTNNNHPWRLFKQSWEVSVNYSSTKFCESLTFDKTITLNNYSLQLAAYVHSNLLRFDSSKEGWSRFEGVNGDITNTIFTHLNASASFKFYDRIGSQSDDGTFQGFFEDLRSGSVDFAMNMNLQRFHWRFQTYPHESSGFCMVSLKHPSNFFDKLQVICSRNWTLVLGFIFLFTTTALKYLLNESLSGAALEFLRMLMNVTTVRTPSRGTCRCIFIQAWFLLMVLNVLFQSRLSSMDVALKTRVVVDSLDDLVNSDMTIYGTLQYNELLSGVDVAKRYRISNYSDCVARLKNGEPVVCLPGCIEARYSLFESDKYHISKNAVRNFLMVFSTRVDWPLLNRFDKIIRHMGEAGFIKLFRNRESKYFEKNTEFEEVKKLDFNNLKFGFDILYFGLFTGLCILFTEIGAYHVIMKVKSTLVKRNNKTLQNKQAKKAISPNK